MVDITLGGAVRPAGEVGVSVNPPAGPLPLLVTPVTLWLTARLEGEQLTLTAHGATSYSGDLTAVGHAAVPADDADRAAVQALLAGILARAEGRVLENLQLALATTILAAARGRQTTGGAA